MPELTVGGVFFSYDDEPFLENMTFELEKGDRLGLVGKNGAGKTTLLNLIGNELEPDLGNITIARGRRVGILRQIPKYPEHFTGRDVLLSAFEELDEMEAELKSLSESLAENGDDRELLAAYGRLQSAFEGMGGYDRELEFKRVAGGLNIPQNLLEGRFNLLSGGERTRLHLARMILRRCDLMLLDEPTNHLDIPSLEWLEDYLTTFPGTLLTVSHDRYFLDRVTNKTAELRDGGIKIYPGNFSAFERLRREELEFQQRMFERTDAERKRLEDLAARLHARGSTLMHKRAHTVESRIDRIEQVDRVRKERAMKARFTTASRSGNDLLSIENLSFSYGERSLLDGISFKMKKDERIGLIGHNGAGKTTFIKLLTGGLKPVSGRIIFGVNVKWGYLSQHPETYPRGESLTDITVRELGVTTGEARNILAGCLFSGEDAFKFPSDLSGGEMSRFRLCLLMRREVNLLLLDEPTNHLDIASREWVENAVESYPGSLIFVSHDRYFIKSFANRLLELDDGRIYDFPFGYEEYISRRDERRDTADRASTPPAPERAAVSEPTKEPPSGQKDDTPRSKRERLSPSVARRRAEARLSSAERETARLEELCRALDEQIEAAATDHVELMRLSAERQTADNELTAAYAEWESAFEALEELTGGGA